MSKRTASKGGMDDDQMQALATVISHSVGTVLGGLLNQGFQMLASSNARNMKVNESLRNVVLHHPQLSISDWHPDNGITYCGREHLADFVIFSSLQLC